MQLRDPAKLRYSEEELLRSHEFAVPHVEAGLRLHGGFDAEGAYVPPRALLREPALEAWEAALAARGGEPLAADNRLLAGIRYPNPEQMKLLLLEGLGQSFWNMLTITGQIEARGRVLAEMSFPDFQPVVVEDVSQMALGHLHAGLLKAHGLDEGGEPAKGLGGHDTMWFALRDLVFPDADFPDPPDAGNIARPDEALRARPNIQEGPMRVIYFLLNLLLIEFRAERGFSMTEALLMDPDLFREDRAAAGRAAEIVRRIRRDEAIHVRSLRLVLGEIRHCHFHTLDGGTIAGHEIVDGFWAEICQWATVEQPKLVAEQQRAIYRERIAAHPEAERIQAAFDALEDQGWDGETTP